MFYFMSHSLPQNADQSEAIFTGLSEESRFPLLITFCLSLVVYLAISAGISSIERINLAAVPVLFSLILFGFYYSLFLPRASTGIKLIFSMDWSVLENAKTMIDGISQNAWDTGAGTGIYFTFATYMKKEQKIVGYAFITPILNNLISLMMGK